MRVRVLVCGGMPHKVDMLGRAAYNWLWLWPELWLWLWLWLSEMAWKGWLQGWLACLMLPARGGLYFLGPGRVCTFDLLRYIL